VSTDIRAHVVVGDAGMSGHGHMTLLALSWTADDPLAVQVRLSAEPDHPALPRGQWVVLRDFLRYGIDEPTGDGCVRIRPDDGRMVALDLEGPARSYTVQRPAQVLGGFLDETERVVPAGAEADDAMLDALIARLVGD
jgi:hypothetical protein